MKHIISAEQQESDRSPSAAHPASIEGESDERATGHQAGAKAEETVLRNGLGRQRETEHRTSMEKQDMQPRDPPEASSEPPRPHNDISLESVSSAVEEAKATASTSDAVEKGKDRAS